MPVWNGVSDQRSRLAAARQGTWRAQSAGYGRAWNSNLLGRTWAGGTGIEYSTFRTIWKFHGVDRRRDDLESQPHGAGGNRSRRDLGRTTVHSLPGAPSVPGLSESLLEWERGSDLPVD